jgi:membrane protein YdbS with pleckstrin-like domain
MTTENFENGEVVRFKPSQYVNIVWIFILGLCMIMIADSIAAKNFPTLHPKLIGISISHLWWMVFPVMFCFWKILVIACWRYEFTIGGDTITIEKGVFTRTKIDVHRFRIKSIKMEKPFLLRLMGLSNVILLTSEPFMPILTFYAIPNGDDPRPADLAKYLLDSSTYWRSVKGVKETDFHSF